MNVLSMYVYTCVHMYLVTLKATDVESNERSQVYSIPIVHM